VEPVLVVQQLQHTDVAAATWTLLKELLCYRYMYTREYVDVVMY
jgi:hypothetical protein